MFERETSDTNPYEEYRQMRKEDFFADLEVELSDVMFADLESELSEMFEGGSEPVVIEPVVSEPVDFFAELDVELSRVMFEELDAELSAMFDEPKTLEPIEPKTIQKPKTAQRRGRRSKVEDSYNETTRYLYSNKAKIWEEWSSQMISYALKKGLVNRSKCGDTRKAEATDMVYSFLAWMCEEDKLKGRTSESVMFHWVQSTMFVQWVQRNREKEGQDALSRTRDKNNRTQQERRVGSFNISSPEASKKVSELDEETGEEKSVDFYNPNDQNEAEEQIYLAEVKAVVDDAIRKATSDDEEAELWVKVWEIMVLQKDPSQKLYETDQAWADEWEMPVSSLRRMREKVKKVVLECGLVG